MANYPRSPGYPSPSIGPLPPNDSEYGGSTTEPMLESDGPEHRATRTMADPTQQSSMEEQGGKPSLSSDPAPTQMPRLGASFALPGDSVIPPCYESSALHVSCTVDNVTACSELAPIYNASSRGESNAISGKAALPALRDKPHR